MIPTFKEFWENCIGRWGCYHSLTIAESERAYKYAMNETKKEIACKLITVDIFFDNNKNSINEFRNKIKDLIYEISE